MIFNNAHNVTRKKKTPWGKIIFLSILLIILPLSYIYGPTLYHRYSGDSQYKIEQKSISWALRIHSQKYDRAVMNEEIKAAQKILQIIQNKEPMSPSLHLLQAKLIFYKLMIKMPLNGHNLMQLTGRGYMPLTQKIENDTSKQTPISYAKKIAITTRRALAIDPNHKNQAEIFLLLLYSDFIFTGRTDPQLLHRLNQIDATKLPEHFLPWHNWISIALYTLMGEITKSQKVLQALKQNTTLKSHDRKRYLAISKANTQLILCHSYFYGKKYMQSLRLARLVKNNTLLSASTRSEATRMEAEIFLKQRGKKSALYYFQEALVINEVTDPYIQQRIDKLSK